MQAKLLAKSAMKLKLICISDTHGDHAEVQVPEGDVLLHAGDITAHGSKADYSDFLAWFAAKPHKHKVFIAGNHDNFLEEQPDTALQMATDAGVHYLNDSGIEIDGVHFWGCPITPRFFTWAFMRDPGSDIEKHWNLIPEGTDVLVTHGPPFGILDEVHRAPEETEQTGCKSLLKRIVNIKPQYHIFGHIHECYGRASYKQVEFANVSTMNRFYKIENEPVVLDVFPRQNT